MRLLNYLGVILAVFFILALPSVSGYQYNIDYYDFGDWSATPTLENMPVDCRSDLGITNCAVNDSSQIDVVGTGSYTTTVKYYSPYDTFVGSGSVILSGNNYCLPISTFVSNENSDEVAEAKEELTGGFTTAVFYNKRSVMKETDDNWFNWWWHHENNITDTSGYYPELFVYNTSWYKFDIWNGTDWLPAGEGDMNGTDYDPIFTTPYNTICNNVSVVEKVNDFIHSAYLGTGGAYPTRTTDLVGFTEYYFLFNSTYGGGFNMFANVSIGSRWGGNYAIGYKIGEVFVQYYKFDNPSGSKVTVLSEDIIGVNFSGTSFKWREDKTINTNITDLTPDTLYVIVLGIHSYANKPASSADAEVKTRLNELNISLFAITPTWQCGDWSDCVSYLQHRYCTDLGGNFLDKIEYRSCLPVEERLLRTINLGFEDDYVVTHIARCSIGAFCLPYVSNISGRFFPTDWSVTSPFDPVGRELKYLDTLAITTEQSTERYKSLKMWDIPIGSLYVFPDNLTGNLYCGNHTWWYSLSYWDTNRRINETTWIEHNITLPAPYSLTFDVRKCDVPVTEFYSYYPCVYGQPTDVFHTWQTCYGNCNSTPKGEFAVHLGAYNLTDTWEVLDYRSSAVEEWRHYAFNLGNLVNNETQYTLSYYLDIEDHYNSYCIYIDNVNLVPTIVVTEDQCVSSCDNITYGLYHRATWDNDVCIEEDEYLSSVCLASEDYDDVVDGRGWYCDVTTKVYWDIPQLEWIRVENNEDCIEEARERGLTDPYIDPSRLGDTDYIAEQGGALLLLFLSPAFISMFISLIISVFIGIKLKDNLLFPVIAFLGLLTIFSLAGMFPILLLIILIVVTGLILAKTMFGFFGG